MIAWTLLIALALISLRMVLWGLREKERFFQYPTLAGATWLLYVVPGAIGSLRNPGKFPQAVLDDYGLEIALLMCTLCALCGWWGYQREPQAAHPAAANRTYSLPKLFWAGVALYAIAFYAAYELAELTGGFVEQFTRGGHYSLEWTGLPVRYVFVAQMVYSALLLCLLAALHRPRVIKSFIIGFFCLYPLAVTVFLGRRSATAFVALIFLIALQFARGWALPRLAFVGGLALMAIFGIVAPEYRSVAQYGFDMEKLREIQVPAAIQDVLAGDTYVEFDALVVSAAAYDQTRDFGLGTGFYNSTIGQLVPRQLVGEAIKESLMVTLWEGQASSYRLYQWDIPYGSNPTGPLTAFGEFWFFGAFVYWLIGMFARRIWEAAYKERNLKAQVWYTIWATLIPASIYGSLLIIPGQLLVYALFLAPLLWLVQERKPASQEAPGQPSALRDRLGNGRLEAVRAPIRNSLR